jgi:RimJ/RimL family protein N-acetyltransferase
VQLLQKYASVNVAKDPGDIFLMHLATRRDAWFVEIGQVGLCYLTVIQPGFSGTLNLIFWDRKLPQRRVPAVQAVLRTAAELFDLQRIAAFTPSNPLKVFLKHVGFTHEGTLRQSMFIDGAPVDAFALGLLRAEITWPHSMISSAQV